MPNWADCEMSVVLPSKNADKFENLFLERDRENNKEKERYFQGTCIDSTNLYDSAIYRVFYGLYKK